MREVKQNTFINEVFFMASSADYATGVTSLGFPNSGDIQLRKPGGSFTDITSACVVTEEGFGWYSLVSSLAAHMDTLGRSVIHLDATTSGSAWPAELLFDVVENRAADVFDSVSSVQADVGSYGQYKADITSLLAGVANGTVYVPTASVSSNSPIEVHQRSNYDAIFYLSAAFSGYAGSGYPVWFSGKLNEYDDSYLWTVQGTVSNVNSMSAVFSLDPTSHTNHDPTRQAHYEIQFRNTSGTVVKVAMYGGMKILPTLKL